MTFADWTRAPNIAEHPEIYERENEAIARDGRLDAALREVADWTGRELLDIGCGTGFWLPRYGQDAASVVGVEPDPELLARARERVAREENIDVRAGSAEHLPLPADSVDLAHARFAYFFGAGADTGLAEAARVLRPDGTLVVVDNAWTHGEFAELLHESTEGNAAVDPDATDRWWRERGSRRIDVEGGWSCRSAEELETILRIEFPDDVIDRFLAGREPSPHLSYGYALFVWPATGGGPR
ncbi:MAG: class I SAM-dependent methyltransferase [Nitriliruptorales bacterium]|nr:class I SAM-dependent methyltransferase [Nitriliruptorales bacterium]